MIISNNYNINCSDICFWPEKKIILDIKQCVLNCPDEYNFEYQNICYRECPNGTHPLNNSNKCLNDETEQSIINDYISSTDLLTSFTSENESFQNLSQENYSQDIYDFINQSSIIKVQMINKIKEDILNGKINISNIINGENKNILFSEDNIIYEITSSNNKNKTRNISTINLGNCEKI